MIENTENTACCELCGGSHVERCDACGAPAPLPDLVFCGDGLVCQACVVLMDATKKMVTRVDKMDAVQAAVERMPQAEMPLTHRFTPGMYARTIVMPAGALVVSKVHRTEHPFVVTRGSCSVWDGERWERVAAGHIGITKPGTRRIIYIYEETEWTTFHATSKITPEAVEADIIEPHDFDRAAALQLFADSTGAERIDAKEVAI